MTRLLLPALPALVALAAGCTDKKAVARADSLQAVAAEQMQLTTQLSAQKDSLTRVIFEADDFIAQIDSQISTVKGMPKKKASTSESPIEAQLEQRKQVLARVDALVKRAKTTAAQLAESRRREQALRGEVATLQEQRADDQRMIEELSARIQRQTETIAQLQLQVDSLTMGMRTIGAAHYKAYYVIGTEKELMAKGLIRKEGGANLLLLKPGRTLQPSRTLPDSLFTAIDQRDVREIQVPDTTRRYRIVSRQSLDNAEVQERDKETFRGNLRITNVEQFWAPSRYLILVQRN